MWTYIDIYQAIVFYINQDLRDTDYTLNFGVVGIATQSLRAVVKFCLRNVQTNRQKCWKAIVVGETTRELEASMRISVRDHVNQTGGKL